MDRFNRACSITVALLALSARAEAPVEPRFSTPHGPAAVAFVLTENANVMDFAGPWEVFQDVHVEGRGSSMEDMMPFALCTVSDKTEMIHATSGLKIIPDFTFENAPPPRVVVVPAQAGRS